jgi:hypothetical protein
MAPVQTMNAVQIAGKSSGPNICTCYKILTRRERKVKENLIDFLCMFCRKAEGRIKSEKKEKKKRKKKAKRDCKNTPDGV